jgi:acetyltransferase-like isoleucine patch superfamily enzyme
MNDEKNLNLGLSELQKKLRLNSLSSAANEYRCLVVGEDSSWLNFTIAELYTLMISNLSGALGLGSRRYLLPYLLGGSGKGLMVERGCSFRQGEKIRLGDFVALDEGVGIIVKGRNSSIVLGNNVAIGRSSLLVAKSAYIEISSGVNISSFCRIATESSVEIGESTLIAAYSYIGPGNHSLNNETDKPLIERSMELKNGTKIGKNCWIGAGSIILDGVTLEDNVVVGANSLVKDSFASGSIVGGTPARVIGNL